MTGIGRTGKNFAVDHWQVVPDMIVCAKGMASGYTPVFCVVTNDHIHDTIKQGNGAFVHGHTYSQNPLSCATALAVLDYMKFHDLINRSARMGQYLLEKLKTLSRHSIVGMSGGLTFRRCGIRKGSGHERTLRRQAQGEHPDRQPGI